MLSCVTKIGMVMTLSEIAAIIAAIVSGLTLWRSITDKRFDEVKEEIKEFKEEVKDFRKEVNVKFDKVDQELKEVRGDLSDVKERIAAIEVSTIFLQVNPDPQSRSEAAKRMWEKRRSKIEKKED